MAASGIDTGEAKVDEALAEPFSIGADGFWEANHGMKAMAVHDGFATGVDFEGLVAEPVEGGLAGFMAEFENLWDG